MRAQSREALPDSARIKAKVAWDCDANQHVARASYASTTHFEKTRERSCATSTRNREARSERIREA
jgi:hypothetical protein